MRHFSNMFLATYLHMRVKKKKGITYGNKIKDFELEIHPAIQTVLL